MPIRPPKKRSKFVFFNNKTGKFRMGETAKEGEKKYVLDGSPVKAKNKRDLMNQRFDNAFAGTKLKKQSKGPDIHPDKVMKKKRGGKVDATNLNIKKKYGKAIKERLQSKNSRAKSR